MMTIAAQNGISITEEVLAGTELMAGMKSTFFKKRGMAPATADISAGGGGIGFMGVGVNLVVSASKGVGYMSVGVNFKIS